MPSCPVPSAACVPIPLYVSAAANGRHVAMSGMIHRIQGGWIVSVSLADGDEPIALFFADGKTKVLPWIAGQLGLDVIVQPTQPEH